MSQSTDSPELNNDAPEEERMRALVDSLSAYIEHFHGGAVKMVAYEGQVLQVHMMGACDGCSLAPVTLHGWVEGTVRQFFPELKAVEAV
ncbi:MAG: NifU family protein [Chloroflexi bacterium]|nr:NifU family protein [Chloroflexota bacterium]